ncbi:MAG: tRNA uridine-5-carboxymethylaminomethyl(34) synthesis GTPase MnmE [Candidatus Aminicenantes bacterium]|nr:MAG: tRNA uridine-5-carboxymethylaminomethyl(34) synthesis GTPase MnmE [Candidatus Aminicenantes bacterium]
MFEDTIIAISTPIGHGGLGIVRLSGKKSLSIAKKIFKPKKRESKIMPKRPVLGDLYNHEQKDYFEEAFLTYFPRPYTYTREDMVEISCHGSPVILEQLVRLGIKEGARHADPGEFTLRAYMNGRIDILQAEAVNDIIQAASYKQAKISYKQLEGSLSNQISSLRAQIIHLFSQVEARIEFPDEGLRTSTKQILKTLKKGISSVNTLVESYDLGKSLAEGVTLAITGRANVGKSTLFNSLLEKDRAIVTPHPGTTRDFLKECIRVRDSIFTLIDMAGLGTPLHPVEKEGIKRGKKLASLADGILLLLDVSCKETPEDFKLIEKFKDKKTLLIFNKIDLTLKMNTERVKKQAENIPNIEISALKGTNLKKLKEKIYKLFIPDLEEDKEIILHLRQKLILDEILDSLIEGQNLLKQGYPEEIYSEEIRKVIPLIGQLTGEIRADDIINDIFSRFCVGK